MLSVGHKLERAGNHSYPALSLTLLLNNQQAVPNSENTQLYH